MKLKEKLAELEGFVKGERALITLKV